jgi:hypothetical protein
MKTQDSPKIKLIRAVAYLLFALGLALSVKHIFELFHNTLHASIITAAAVPLFIDGFQLVGRIIRGHEFSIKTRRTGAVLQGFGAIVSLAANIVAGPTVGEKIAGAIFVIGYITIEAVAERIRPASDDTKAADAAKRAAARQAAAATRAANKAAKDAADAERKERDRARRERAAMARENALVEATVAAEIAAEIAALNQKYAAECAPISPAPVQATADDFRNPAAYL